MVDGADHLADGPARQPDVGDGDAQELLQSVRGLALGVIPFEIQRMRKKARMQVVVM